MSKTNEYTVEQRDWTDPEPPEMVKRRLKVQLREALFKLYGSHRVGTIRLLNEHIGALKKHDALYGRDLSPWDETPEQAAEARDRELAAALRASRGDDE